MAHITGSCDFVDTGNGNFERPDIALERDKSQGKIRQNAHDRRLDTPRSADFSDDGRKLSAIVLDLMKNEKARAVFWKEDICNDMDIHEAVNNACIALGIRDDDFCPSLHDLGHVVEIYLS